MLKLNTYSTLLANKTAMRDRIPSRTGMHYPISSYIVSSGLAKLVVGNANRVAAKVSVLRIFIVVLLFIPKNNQSHLHQLIRFQLDFSIALDFMFWNSSSLIAPDSRRAERRSI